LKPVNSFVERLHVRRDRLRAKKIDARIQRGVYYNGKSSGNSFVERLRAYERRLESKRKYNNNTREFVYVGQSLLDECPVCKSRLGNYIRAVTLRVGNRFTGRVYGFATYIQHRVYDRAKQVTKEVKFCYCARNLYDVSHGDRLPIDAPVLEHFYLQRDGQVVHDKKEYVLPSEFVDPCLKWGYGK